MRWHNYRKGHFRFSESHPLAGLGVISIETAKGRERTASDGSWTVPDMPYHYGHLQIAGGKDGEKADVAIGPDYGALNVYVIDQIDPDTGDFNVMDDDEYRDYLAAGGLGASAPAGCDQHSANRRMWIAGPVVAAVEYSVAISATAKLSWYAWAAF